MYSLAIDTDSIHDSGHSSHNLEQHLRYLQIVQTKTLRDGVESRKSIWDSIERKEHDEEQQKAWKKKRRTKRKSQAEM
jgi:hypothetical protein